VVLTTRIAASGDENGVLATVVRFLFYLFCARADDLSLSLRLKACVIYAIEGCVLKIMVLAFSGEFIR